MTTKPTALLCLLATLLFTGCIAGGTYQITSSPSGALCFFAGPSQKNTLGICAGNTYYKKTPATAHSFWPFCAVEWSDGTCSEWRRLNKNQHFVKGEYISPTNEDSVLQNINYSLNSKKRRWGTPVKNSFLGLFSTPISLPLLAKPDTQPTPSFSKPPEKQNKLQITNLNFDSETNLGSITFKGFENRHLAIQKISEICSSKNVAHIAGEENLETGGVYKILDEHLQNNILTINFEAVY